MECAPGGGQVAHRGLTEDAGLSEDENNAKHRTYSIDFKRQVAREFLVGETLHGLAKRHDVSRNLVRIWVAKFEAGAFDDDAQAADLL